MGNQWSSEEIAFLEANYQKLTYKEIAEKLGRSENAVACKLSQLKLKKERRWTAEEIEFLKQNYIRLSVKEIAEKLGRTLEAVRAMAKRLKITRPIEFIKNRSLIKTQELVSRLSEREKGYIAGLVDGEGTITIQIREVLHNKKKDFHLCPLLLVSNSNRTVMEWLKEKLGGKTIVDRYTRRDKKLGFRKIYYTFEMRGKRILPVLEAICPSLQIKREQCEAVIQFIKSRLGKHQKQRYTSQELELFWKVRRLNLSEKEFSKLVSRIRQKPYSTYIRPPEISSLRTY
jgi:biotin operon repressor